MFDFLGKIERDPVDLLFSGVDCGFIHRSALQMRASAVRVRLDISYWIAKDKVIGMAVDDDGGRALAVRHQYDKVKAAADAIKALAVAEPEKLSASEINTDDLSGLTAMQRCAVVNAFDSRISVITGGPGTGKTHTMSTIVKAARALGYEVLLLAPTGKAARRMSEMSGVPARTVHSWIRYPYSAHIVIIDECSMIDQRMFCSTISVLEGAQPKPNIVMVGDIDQLPSVEHGEVLRDVTTFLGTRGKVTTLDVVHRQGSDCPGILAAAYSVLRNEVITSGYGPGFSRAAEVDVVDAAVRFAKWAQASGKSWLVLSPYRNKRYEGNIQALNKAISSAIIGDGKGQGGYRVGDRVLFTQNNWDSGYVNGQMGTIVKIGSDDSKDYFIESDGREYWVPWEDRANIELAWATTVHKAQGSEADYVALVIADDERLQTELIYTGITRAKQRVFLITGSEIEAIHSSRRGATTTMLGCLLNIKQGA